MSHFFDLLVAGDSEAALSAVNAHLNPWHARRRGTRHQRLHQPPDRQLRPYRQNARYTLKGRRDASAAFLADYPVESGAMMPMVVGPDQLVGHLLLFRRQAGV
jgi:hypothetical protein